MKKNRIIKIGISSLALAAFQRVLVFADVCDLDPDNPACEDGPSALNTANGIINAMLAMVGVAAVIVIIIGGIMITTSAGDPGKVKKGKTAILYAVIGLILAVAAMAIVNFVLDLT